MTVLDGLWHLLNVFAPALGVGMFTAVLAKLVWWGELRGVAWWRLAGWGVGSASIASIAGFVLSGHEGKMFTYAGMATACALGQWWAGWRSGR